jgi:hypothetical protein
LVLQLIFNLSTIVLCKTLNSFKVFEIKRKLGGFSSVEGFFELHSSATEGRKGKNRAEISNFLAN